MKTIEETVEQIKNGEIDVVELVKTHIKAAKESQLNTNAFITIFDGDTNTDQYNPIEVATRIREEVKNNSSEIENLKLLGIPFTVKDLYLVKDTKTTFGSKLMEDFVAPYTSTVVQKVLNQGAILIGKCNNDPWGFGSTGENSGYGPTKNPFDLTRSPGGSSSGSAASLASGVGFFSLGTDTGGSVRLPASVCGLYGYKPTYGKNSRFGIGTMGSSFDTPGFFTRNIFDTIYLEKIIEGKDKNDPTTLTEEEIENIKKPFKNGKNKKYKVALPKEFFDAGLDSDIKEVLQKKIEDIKKYAEVKEVSLPSIKYGLAAYYILVPAEISSNRARYDGVRYGKKVSDDYEQNLIESRTKYLEDEVKRRIMIGTFVLSAGYSDQYYKKANQVRNKLKKEFKELFKEFDYILAPTLPTKIPKLGENINDPLKNYLLDIYNVTANLAGIPSISIPTGKDNEGLPVGIQVMGRWFEDIELMEFVKANV